MGITCLLLFVLYMLDQISKYATQVYQPHNLVVIPHFLTVDQVYNTGAAWGMLENNTIVLVIISIIASIVLGYFCIKNDWKKKKIYSFSLTMTLAGCVGNLFDRLVSVIPSLSSGRQGVVDMISFEPLNWISRLVTGNSFPTFNLADLFLVVGLIIFAINYIFFQDKKDKNEKTNN